MNSINNTKSALRGPKTQSTVGLGSEYPICPEAQLIIDVMENHLERESFETLKDAFLGFSECTQRKMAEFLLNVYLGLLFYGCKPTFTGIMHVDSLLHQIVQTINSKNPIDYPI